MPLTIFWRSILAQIALITLIGGVNFYALAQFNRLTQLSAEIVARDGAFIDEAKRLMRVFLTQMRNAEKYVLLQDQSFYRQFIEADASFERGVAAMAKLIDSRQQQDLLAEIRELHARYSNSLTSGLLRKELTQMERSDVARDLTTRVDDLIRTREEVVARKTASARDRAERAASVVTWMTFGGLGLAVILAYFHARGVSRPLKRLAQELRLVGEGEFQRSLDLRTPKEVGELCYSFNWMAARLAKLDEMKADFIAHVSHELRTPLTAVREGTTLLWEEIPGPLTSSQREIVNVLRNHSDRLFRFLSSVLDLSKMEAGMMEYLQVPSDLAALLDRSLQSVQLTAQRKGIRLEVVSAAPLPPLLLDEGRMQQAFDNLLDNAMKFTAEGGMVRVAMALTAPEGPRSGSSCIEVRISDTGTGIPAEECEHIFHRFYQSSYHQLQHSRGTGLGLAITRHIVEAHGGRIWVESQVGQGSTFCILFPVQAYDAAGFMPGSMMPGSAGMVSGTRALPVDAWGDRHAL